MLAAWQYGAGRAVAWTSDVGGRRSGAWAGTTAASTLWGNVLSWLLPAQTDGPLSVRVETQNAGTATVSAELAQNSDGGWNDVRPTHAHVVAPDGSQRDVELTPAGPGRYTAQIQAAQPGAYVVRVSQEVAGAVSLRGEAGWVAPYPAEFRQAGVDRALLAQVAAAGGGRMLDDATQAVRPADHATAVRWPAWPLLVVLAAVFWPLEIASRRFSTPAPLSALRPRRATAPSGDTPAEVEPVRDTTADRLLAAKRARSARR